MYDHTEFLLWFLCYQRCWPSFPLPEVGNGYFTQTTYGASALVNRVEFCSWTPCSQYEVFGGCNLHFQGDIFRQETACCLGNNVGDPDLADFDHDGWCNDKDCDMFDPSKHTGCNGGGGGQACFTPGPFDTPPPYSCDPSDIPCSGGHWSTRWCQCVCNNSPIVIDISGNGFNLTGIAGGVYFDLDTDGTPQHMGWVAAGSDDAFLALDRNGNGTIDNGKELFGNLTPQPPSSTPNGFIALAEYDKPQNGGNSDGRITIQDAIFSSLQLWQDANHNGLSELNELHTLSSLGLAILDLDYKDSKRTDQYGNAFKYRAKVKDIHGAQVGRWAWDVFFVSQ